MRLSRRTALALALVLGLLAVGLAWVYLRGQKPPSPTVPQKVQVPVPVASIPTDTDLYEDMFEQASFDPGDVPKDAITDPANLHGSISLRELAEGEPVRASEVARRSTSLRLAYGIPDGFRAITVPVDDVAGVYNFVRPGDHIDLLGLFADPNGDASIATTVLQDVMVLAVNATTTPPEPNGDSEDENQPSSRRGKEQRMVTLAVSPHEAQLAALTNYAGQLQMTLRRTGDREIESLARSQSWSLMGVFPSERVGMGGEAVDSRGGADDMPPAWADLWGGSPMQQPDQPPAASTPAPDTTPSVEVIRGLQREYVHPSQ